MPKVAEERHNWGSSKSRVEVEFGRERQQRVLDAVIKSLMRTHDQTYLLLKFPQQLFSVHSHGIARPLAVQPCHILEMLMLHPDFCRHGLADFFRHGVFGDRKPSSDGSKEGL